MGHSKWVDLDIMFGMIVVYRILFLVINKVNDKSKPIIYILNGAQINTLQ